MDLAAPHVGREQQKTPHRICVQDMAIITLWADLSLLVSLACRVYKVLRVAFSREKPCRRETSARRLCYNALSNKMCNV